MLACSRGAVVALGPEGRAAWIRLSPPIRGAKPTQSVQKHQPQLSHVSRSSPSQSSSTSEGQSFVDNVPGNTLCWPRSPKSRAASIPCRPSEWISRSAQFLGSGSRRSGCLLQPAPPGAPAAGDREAASGQGARQLGRERRPDLNPASWTAAPRPARHDPGPRRSALQAHRRWSSRGPAARTGGTRRNHQPSAPVPASFKIQPSCKSLVPHHTTSCTPSVLVQCPSRASSPPRTSPRLQRLEGMPPKRDHEHQDECTSS